MLIHPRYLARYNVILLLQAFLDTGGKSRADIKHHASEIKDSIKGTHLLDSEAKSLLLGLLANLMDGAPLNRGFVCAMREAGLIPTGVFAYVGGTSSNGEPFRKLEIVAQLAHDVELLEGEIKHDAKRLPNPKRAAKGVAEAAVILAIEDWRKENFRDCVIKDGVEKVPSYLAFCVAAGYPSQAKQKKDRTERSKKVHEDLKKNFKERLSVPKTVRMRG